MREENNYALKTLEDAFIKLREGVEQANDELAQDGVIQRFEFTFEMFWKALKIFLQDKGVDARTPRDVFKEAFKIEWLDEEGPYLNMLEDRNKTSHIYDKKTSREIFNRIKTDYIVLIERVIKKLKNING